jgi:hypothetical protein
MGLNCNFCHLDAHDNSNKTKIRLRPNKGKRMRQQRQMERLSQQVQRDPEAFAPESVVLPPSVEHNPTVRSRVLNQLMSYAQELRAENATSSIGQASTPNPSDNEVVDL